MIAGPGTEAIRPAIDVDMFHSWVTLRDRFREKNVVLQQA